MALSREFSQWQHSFHWKLRCRWLKFLRQRQIAVVIQGPVYVNHLKLNHPKHSLEENRNKGIGTTNTTALYGQLSPSEYSWKTLPGMIVWYLDHSLSCNWCTLCIICYAWRCYNAITHYYILWLSLLQVPLHQSPAYCAEMASVATDIVLHTQTYVYI